MSKSDESKNATSRKRPRKADARQLETEIAEISAARDAAQDKAVKLHSELQDLSRRAAELETQLGELHPELEKAREHVRNADARVAGLEQEAAALRRQVGDAVEARDEARQQLDKELQKAREEIRESAARASGREQIAGALRGELEKLRAESKDQAGQLQQEAAAQSQELEKLRAEAKDRTAQVDEELQKAWEAARETVARASGLEQEAAELRRQIEETAKARDEARRQVEESRVEYEHWAAEMEQRVKTARDEAARIPELEESKGELETQIFDLDHELEEAREGIRKSEARAADLERRLARIPELEEERAALRKEIEQAAQERDESTRILEEARRQLEEFRQEHVRLNGDLKNLQEAHDAARKENARLDLKAASLERQVQRTDARTAEANQRVESLEKALVAANLTEKRATDLADHFRTEVALLEKTRRDQERRLDELGQKAADLERKLQDALAERPAAAVISPDAIEPSAPAAEVVVVPLLPEPATLVPPAESVPQASSETTLRPQHLFGPNGDDGQPAYVLLELLSKDSLGAVYRARERSSSRPFAARFMAGQAGEQQTQAIELEVEKLIALPHPHILHVQGSGRRKNRLYLAMDLVEAPTLGQAKIQEVPRVCAILRDAAGAVHYAHEERIFHGDLNPENILVAREENKDHALVKDFELAHLMETLLPAPSGKEARPLLRNPAFLPPEQTKSVLTVAIDVYSLGATLYAALAGRPPFEGKDSAQVLARVLIEEPLPLERIRPDVPRALSTIVRRAMAKDLVLRYATAKDVADALTKFLEAK